MWSSLQAEHLRLRDTHWEPPPAPPVIFDETPQKLSGARKLTEIEVGQVRDRARKESVSQLAKEYGLTYKAMSRIVKGYSYRYLNKLFPPQA